MSKIKILIDSIRGEIIKRYYNWGLGRLRNGINTTDRKHKVTVSLTSYGRRVNKIVYVTLLSLLKQNYKPDRIILWLDSKNWNNNNIPLKIKKLISRGVEVRFCEDIKSYKKLVPSLLLDLDEYIITVDDDQYYPKDFIKGLVNAMNIEPNCVHAYIVHKITFNNDRLNPYNDWILCSKGENSGLFFATGVGGIIYKPNLLYKDITNSKLFMSLAPKADDVWFFFMEYLMGTRCRPVISQSSILPLDNFYQKLHSGSSLRDTNWGEGLNDRQIKEVMQYYNIHDKDLLEFAKRFS